MTEEIQPQGKWYQNKIAKIAGYVVGGAIIVSGLILGIRGCDKDKGRANVPKSRTVSKEVYNQVRNLEDEVYRDSVLHATDTKRIEQALKADSINQATIQKYLRPNQTENNVIYLPVQVILQPYTVSQESVKAPKSEKGCCGIYNE
jgi:hypothetical protein